MKNKIMSSFEESLTKNGIETANKLDARYFVPNSEEFNLVKEKVVAYIKSLDKDKQLPELEKFKTITLQKRKEYKIKMAINTTSSMSTINNTPQPILASERRPYSVVGNIFLNLAIIALGVGAFFVKEYAYLKLFGPAISDVIFTIAGIAFCIFGFVSFFFIYPNKKKHSSLPKYFVGYDNNGLYIYEKETTFIKYSEVVRNTLVKNTATIQLTANNRVYIIDKVKDIKQTHQEIASLCISHTNRNV